MKIILALVLPLQLKKKDMYFAHNVENSRIDLFKILINRSIEGYEGYKEEIASVIQDAQEYISGKKNIYTIRKEDLPIISFLTDGDTEILSEIKSDNLDKSDFEKILSILNRKKMNLNR